MLVIYVNNVKATMEFYEKAFGWLKMVYKDKKDEFGDVDSYGAMMVDGCVINIVNISTVGHELNLPVPGQCPQAFSIGWSPKDKNVKAAFEKALSVGATAVKTPAPTPWSESVAIVSDPNNITIVMIGKEKQEYNKSLQVYYMPPMPNEQK